MRISQFTEEQLAKIKKRCRTDLYFLGKEVFGKRYTEFTHRSVCDFFVKKDPSFKTFREFAQSYSGPHDRLLLLPRKSYKSTTKVIDNVQWQICWPDIRIIVLTAVNRLASAFMDEFLSYFIVKKGKREGELVVGGEPTFFHQLFPEFAIAPNEVSSEFISPARKEYSKEPTIGALSMEQAGAGWACDVIDFDDCVGEKNTKTGLRLEDLEKGIAMYSKLKMNYGFRHIVGTRYNPDDPYGKLCEANGITEVYGDHDNSDFKYMGRPCWWLKGQQFKQPDYKTWLPNESDLDLFFPEDLPFRFLAKELKEQPETFFSQELNDPQRASNVQFTEDLIRSCMIDRSALPRNGDIFIMWDCALSANRLSDYTVGVVGLLDARGEWWLMDIIRGRFTYSERPYQIVKAIQTFRPRKTGIENANGAENMIETIDRHGKEMKVATEIDWITLGKGTDDAKYERIITLHPWFTGRRIHLLNTIDCMDALIREFARIANKRSKNDIPDAIARLVMQYSGLSLARSQPSPQDSVKDWNEAADEEMFNLIFGQGKYTEGSQERERMLVGRDGKFWSPNSQSAREEPEGFTDSMTGLPSPYRI